MRTLFRLLLLLVLLAAPASAQFGPAADPCPLGAAEGVLRGADVQATLFTNGNLFFGNQIDDGSGYLVPLSQTSLIPGRPLSALFTTMIWVGGQVESEVRVSGATYSSFPFRPGRTGPDGTPPTPAECAAADRIWIVSRDDVAAYLNSAAPTADLAEWPVALGAPVLDGDGVTGNYNLAGGDQPAIRGDVMAWWAMTDTPLDTPAGSFVYNGRVGVDVAVEAFAVRQARFGRDTFYRFTVTNRNAVPLDSAYVALLYDPDLGDAGDDYVGTDTTAQMTFVYNGRDVDNAYGVPPALGHVLAEGPVGLPNGRDDDQDGMTDEPGERLAMTHTPMLAKINGLNIGPTMQAAYFRLQGLFEDGSVIRARGEGRFQPSTVPVTRYGYPGDPVTGEGWSEVNNDGQGRNNAASDRISWMLPVGPFRLEPGASATTTYAIAFAQGTDRFDSIRRLRREARGVRSAVQTGVFDPTRVSGPTRPPTPLSIRRPAPNPFTDAATLQIAGLADGAVARVSVFDVLGRRVSAPLTVAASGPVEVGRGLPAGVYLVRVDGVGFSETLTVVKTR